MRGSSRIISRVGGGGGGIGVSKSGQTDNRKLELIENMKKFEKGIFIQVNIFYTKRSARNCKLF